MAGGKRVKGTAGGGASKKKAKGSAMTVAQAKSFLKGKGFKVEKS